MIARHKHIISYISGFWRNGESDGVLWQCVVVGRRVAYQADNLLVSSHYLLEEVLYSGSAICESNCETKPSEKKNYQNRSDSSSETLLMVYSWKILFNYILPFKAFNCILGTSIFYIRKDWYMIFTSVDIKIIYQTFKKSLGYFWTTGKSCRKKLQLHYKNMSKCRETFSYVRLFIF